MTLPAALIRSPRNRTAAFSLTEIVIALGIIAFAMVAIIGVLPAGMTASREAIDHTVVAAILESSHNRLKNEKLVAGPASFSPAFFDERGVFIPPEAPLEEQNRRLYRADVNVADWLAQPAHTAGLKALTIAISWPVNATGEAVPRDQSRTAVTYPVTTLAGPEWTRIDPQYAPKIEF